MLIAKPSTREDHEQQCHGREGDQKRDVTCAAHYGGEKEFGWIECVNGCVRQDRKKHAAYFARLGALEVFSHLNDRSR